MKAWLTNDPVAACTLKAADRAYSRALDAARDLPFAAKIVAVRKAREALHEAYSAVVHD